LSSELKSSELLIKSSELLLFTRFVNSVLTLINLMYDGLKN